MLRRCFLLCFFLAGGMLWARPELKLGSLVLGNGPARFNDSQAMLLWRISNPDAVAREVVLQLEPDDGYGGAIYSQTVLLPAKTEIEGRTPVMMTRSERYILSLIHQGTRVDKNDILVAGQSSHALRVGLLLDGPESPAYSEIAKHERLRWRFAFTSLRAAAMPNRWDGLREFDVLMLYSPDLSQYTAPQRQAVLDYVRQGGCLIIATPAAALSLRGTLWEELLPYWPVAAVRWDDLQPFREAFGLAAVRLPRRDAQGDLLAVGGMQRLLYVNVSGNPVLAEVEGEGSLCLGRVGLGTVVGLSFDPFELSSRDREFIVPVWEAVTSQSGFLLSQQRPDPVAKMNVALQFLQGYSIPPVRTVLRIFFFYILGSVAILLLAFHWRRYCTGWLAVCAFGVLITLLVFQRARQVVATQPERSFNSLSVSVWNGGVSASHGVGNFFSKSDCRPSLSAAAARTFFVPQPQSSEHEGGTALSAAPLRINNGRDRIGLERLALQQYRPRTVKWFSWQDHDRRENVALPQLALTATGSVLQPWPLPADLRRAQRAVLVLPSAIRFLQISDGEVRESGGLTGVESDTVLLAAVEYVKSLRLRHPALCLIQPARTRQVSFFQVLNDGDAFAGYDFSLKLVPVGMAPLPEKYRWENGLMRLDLPAQSHMRQFWQRGEFQPVFIQGSGMNEYAMDLVLCPELLRDTPTQARVFLDVANPSGKAAFDILLRSPDGEDVRSSRREGNWHYFDHLPESLLNRREGRLRMVLKATIRDDGGLGGTQRINTWQILAMQAEMD